MVAMIATNEDGGGKQCICQSCLNQGLIEGAERKVSIQV